MTDLERVRERDTAIAAALAAGAIHRRWHAAAGLGTRTKHDGTLVTDSDLEANAAIVERLTHAFPGDAILAEESHDPPDRLQHERLWLVDPLDGTRELVAGSGQFAVHVALACCGVPVVGVVYVPVGDRLYHAIAGRGAFERVAGSDVPLRVSTRVPASPCIGVTRLGSDARLERLRQDPVLGAGLVGLGASLKLIAVARGDLDASLALTNVECEWDTCAPELVIREAGGVVTDLDGKSLRYNQPDVRRRRGLLASNGRVHAALLARVQPFAEGLS